MASATPARARQSAPQSEQPVMVPAVPGEGHYGRTSLSSTASTPTGAPAFAANVQQSRINDRLAFPDGCPTHQPTSILACANGDVDVYDFRSEGEKRKVASWGRIGCRSLQCLAYAMARVSASIGRSVRNDLPPTQAYNYVGSTNIFALVALLADPSLTNSTPTVASARWRATRRCRAIWRVTCSRLRLCVCRACIAPASAAMVARRCL